MPETPTSIQFDVNTPVYLNNNPSATWEDLVKECILPVFKEKISSHCAYTEYNPGSYTYPAITIPWHDDTIDGGLFVYINRNKSDTCGTTQAHPTLSIGGKDLLMSFVVRKSTTGAGYGGGSWTNYHMDQYKFIVRILYYTNFMAIGMKEGSSDGYVINAPVIITTLKKGEDVQHAGLYTSNSSDAMVAIILWNGVSGTERYIQPQQFYNSSGSGYSCSGVGLAVPLYDGEIKSDYFYIMSGRYSSCRGSWSNANNWKELLIDGQYSNNLWYKNAFVINGQSFDVFMGTSNSINNSNNYAMILRKHID